MLIPFVPHYLGMFVHFISTNAYSSELSCYWACAWGVLQWLKWFFPMGVHQISSKFPTKVFWPQDTGSRFQSKRHPQDHLNILNPQLPGETSSRSCVLWIVIQEKLTSNVHSTTTQWVSQALKFQGKHNFSKHILKLHHLTNFTSSSFFGGGSSSPPIDSTSHRHARPWSVAAAGPPLRRRCHGRRRRRNQKRM